MGGGGGEGKSPINLFTLKREIYEYCTHNRHRNKLKTLSRIFYVSLNRRIVFMYEFSFFFFFEML